MTAVEFGNEFRVKYNMASFGAPDLNSYEISLFLTQAVRDVVKELYPKYEHTEFAKRALHPLLKVKEWCLDVTVPPYAEEETTIDPVQVNLLVVASYYQGLIAQEVQLPPDLWFIVHEQARFFDPACSAIDIEIVAEDLDNMNKTVKNPFKKPSRRKILRSSYDGASLRLHASTQIECYKIKYIMKYTPIIITDFATDTELIGDETIDGLNTTRITELPVFLHDNIVDRGVILAIKALRENNLKTQIEV